jgi:hypothetical protein
VGGAFPACQRGVIRIGRGTNVASRVTNAGRLVAGMPAVMCARGGERDGAGPGPRRHISFIHRSPRETSSANGVLPPAQSQGGQATAHGAGHGWHSGGQSAAEVAVSPAQASVVAVSAIATIQNAR